jgi:TonB family protein
MKQPASYAPPRRLASPKKQVQLNLRRRQLPPPREDDGDADTQPKSSFWKWVVLVALFHLLLIAGFSFYYAFAPSPPPPAEQFMSLLPTGDVVKGKPGIQQAPKLGATTSAPKVHHLAPPLKPTPPEPVTPPTPAPVAVQPPPMEPAPAPPKPIVKDDAPSFIPDQPKPKLVTPKPPEIKLSKDDLKLVDVAAPPHHKSKPLHKKPVVKPAANDSPAPDPATASTPDNDGLTKDEVASELGRKLEESGVENAVKTGSSGSDHALANPFAAFYASVRDQVMSKWVHPDLADETAVNPEVTIHVETDGRVPPESVVLSRSSGNRAFDDSAVAAAKSLGYLLQPLPEGCPPDIHITFKLTN